MKSIEKPIFEKNEENRPSIRLEIFRHDEKAAATTSGPRLNDREVRLTPAGRVHATQIGKERNPHPEVGLAYGSPYERSVETAARGLLANEDIKPEDSLEDIKAKIANHMEYGQKCIVDNRLNSIWDGEGVSKRFHDEGYDHFLSKKDALKWIYNDSDRVVLEEKDRVATSYSRAAGNIAELVKKYMTVLPRWEKITREDAIRPEEQRKNYSDFQNELQRFMGTHAAAVETFLIKSIEKKEGNEGIMKFFQEREDNKISNNNFKPNEGYSVKIYAENNQTVAELNYQGKSWKLSAVDIEGMIEDRDELDRKVAK